MEDKLSDPMVAECVGLWLAEGDNKTKSEITFTNNCWDLIDLFYKTINEVFKDHEFNQRIYVYSKSGGKVEIPYKDCVIKYYRHERATKPYFIFRIASVKMIKEWRDIVSSFLGKEELFPFILRGFFAGEGNIHVGAHSSRTIRISQRVQKEFIDEILDNLKISFYFYSNNRNYIINKKSNWDIFADLKLADLHPDKKEKFWRVYNDFKQEHYEKHYLIKKIFSFLDEPHTARQLSKVFNRSFARIMDILVELKKQKKITYFKVGSVGYWTIDNNLLIISKLKKNYLLFLDRPKQTSRVAKQFGVGWKSSFRRLKELEKLGLVKRGNDGKWIKLRTKKKILVI